MREELEIKLTNALVGYVSQEQLSEIRFKFAVLLSDYEIGMRETELAVMDESRNEMAIKRFVATKLAAGRSRKTLLYYKQSLDAFFFSFQNSVCEIQGCLNLLIGKIINVIAEIFIIDEVA